MHNRRRFVLVAVALVVFLPGCRWLKERDFDILVGNHTDHPLKLSVDGDDIGQVMPQRELLHTVTLEPTSGGGYGYNGNYGAIVTVSAIDTVTNRLAEKPGTYLLDDRVTKVEFTVNDFPQR